MAVALGPSIREGGDPKKPARDQSTIQFPYADLDEAISIARILRHGGGVPMSRDQLAARMSQKATSGAFITKISAARMFGLVNSVEGKIKLAQLGHEVTDTDESRQRGAKAAAFLKVELYRKLYEVYRGTELPPRPIGLEDALVNLGVAPKQKTNARYAFDRSAKQAGFFQHGTDRLIEPIAEAGIEPPPPPPPPARDEERGRVEPTLDGVITALIQKLPEDGPWPLTERTAWLTMMTMAFDMAYGREGAIDVRALPSASVPPPVSKLATEDYATRRREDIARDHDPDDEIPF